MSDEKRVSLAEKLNKAFEIQEEEKRQDIIKDYVSDKDTHDDFEYSRQIIKDMISKGQDAIDHLAEISKETEQARHYEVLANLIKTTTDNAQSLLDIRKKKKDIDKQPVVPQANDGKTPEINSQNTNVFIGTTNDLLSLIKEQQKEASTPPVNVTPKTEE